MIDNQPSPEDIKTKLACRFCHVEKGIKIYVDWNTLTVNTELTAVRYLKIGWAHLSCIHWNNYLEWVDNTKFELKQDAKIFMSKTNVCKYCRVDSSLHPTTCCGFKKSGSTCNRSYHVRCAINLGFITNNEVMKEFQTINGRTVSMCSNHTRNRRTLESGVDMNPDNFSEMTNAWMQPDKSQSLGNQVRESSTFFGSGSGY